MVLSPALFLPWNSGSSQKRAEPPSWAPAAAGAQLGFALVLTNTHNSFFSPQNGRSQRATAFSVTHTPKANNTAAQLKKKEKKKACYHLPRTASQEGPSAPFLGECLKERKEKTIKEDVRAFTRGFSSHRKRSFWFDFYEFNRSAEEKRARPLLPPLLKPLQREFYGKQARHLKMQQIKSCGTKRSDLPFSPFGRIKAKRAAFYMFILFFRVFSQGERGSNLSSGKATLWER